ncbi:MAG: pyridoxal-phosphate dependent enzyme [Phycisphaerae bacterium]|jgi:cystathionine beta-synthase|nr:pyridoxal-phosphate dependent enzyme [Phycisphaerae bacterium]MBT6165415.1 pyridoxal-phosphate dependent enzyme [Phycisphaerae bacterium]
MQELTHERLVVVDSVLDLVGNTPILKLNALDTGKCDLFLKLESQNPGQSIKDRIAITMIERAEKDGLLKEGVRIIEATAGNTGIALALIASLKGYDITVVVPDKMSEGKIAHLRAMGADVIMARSDVAKGDPEYYQDVAERLATENGWFFVNQFSNEANVEAHYNSTGPEIWQQLEGNVDAVIIGVGSGGTITGIGRYLKEQNPNIEIILADPEGSVLEPLVNEGKTITAGSWLVEGIGEDFVPPITDLGVVSKAYYVSDKEAFTVARELLKKEGILAGSSTGTLLATALKWCNEQTEPKRVVTFACDHGSKYLNKMFNDYWMLDQGFIDRENHGDLRDLVARRHSTKEDFTLIESLPVIQAIKNMRLYDISQMAVLDSNGKVVGILDESDILLAVVKDANNFTKPVSEFMTTELSTISADSPIDALMPLFAEDKVAIVFDGDTYLGLITKIDLITHLRKQLAR